MHDWRVENWLDDSRCRQIEYFSYWNDEEKEKVKEMDISDGNYDKLEHYLSRMRLPQDLKTCLEVLAEDYHRGLEGVGIDLAAGNLWAVPYLLNFENIDKLYCLEISKHRLFKLGPQLLSHYSVPMNKVVLVYGNFYELKLRDKSMDFAFLSSALHHAERPKDLLSEIYRVLKPGGICIIIGEPYVQYYRAYLKHRVKSALLTMANSGILRRLLRKTINAESAPPFALGSFPVDRETGDHYYPARKYYSMFKAFRFKIRHICPGRARFQSFLLFKTLRISARTWKASISGVKQSGERVLTSRCARKIE